MLNIFSYLSVDDALLLNELNDPVFLEHDA